MRQRLPFDPERLRRYPRPEVAFVAALARYQDEHGIDSPSFARSMGVSPELWRHTRGGRQSLGPKLLAAGANLVSHAVYQAALDSLLQRIKEAA